MTDKINWSLGLMEKWNEDINLLLYLFNRKILSYRHSKSHKTLENTFFFNLLLNLSDWMYSFIWSYRIFDKFIMECCASSNNLFCIKVACYTDKQGRNDNNDAGIIIAKWKHPDSGTQKVSWYRNWTKMKTDKRRKFSLYMRGVYVRKGY